MQFINLAAQQRRLRPALDAAIAAVLDHGRFIMGPEVTELETQLAAFAGVDHCISCANGTDALQLALMAFGLRTGDAVFVPSFTFASTVEVVPCMGATPVFVDIDPQRFTMDPESLTRSIDHARTLGLRPAAVIAVDLFGLPADYDQIGEITRHAGLRLIADAAQSFGARHRDRRTGSIGEIATTSFFPAKPLGCYGDGGALFTADPDLAALLDSLRVHGKGREKYDNVRIGMNSRLDTLQAAILLLKLAVYEEEIEARQRVADRYNAALLGRFETPVVPEVLRSVWAQYTLRVRSGDQRDRLIGWLREEEIPCGVYYPTPLHRQTAYRNYPGDPAGLGESEHAAACVVSLPMSPDLTISDQDRVISRLLAFPESGSRP